MPACAATIAQPPMRPAVLTLALLASGLLSCAAPPTERSLIGAVSTAAKGLRPIAPRLTGFDYATCAAASSVRRPPTLCGGAPSLSNGRLPAIERRLRAAAASSPSAETLHALALWDLLWIERDARLDRVTERLEEAVVLAPRDATILSDLAAAHMVRASIGGEAEHLLWALQRCDQAIALDARLPAARFNRALILESLYLDQAARVAWQEYLALGEVSPWTREAKEHLQARSGDPSEGAWQEDLREAGRRGDQHAVERLVRRFPQAAREYVERTLLPAWARGVSTDDPSRQDFELARLIGEALVQAGDRLILDAITTIVETSANERQRLVLARGHIALDEGYAAYRRGDNNTALAQLDLAQERLAAAGSPFTHWAAFFRACVDYQTDDYPASLAQLAIIEREISETPYVSLQAHVSWMQGLNLFVSGKPLESLDDYAQALERFELLGERENAAAIHAMTGESLDLLGRPREAWQSFYQALDARDVLRDPKRVFAIYVTLADAALRRGWPAVALYFQDEAVAAATRTGNLQFQADSLYWRGLMRARAGRVEAGTKDLARAREHAGEISDPAIRRRVSAEIALIEGSLLTSTDPAAAKQHLDRAIKFYEGVLLKVQATNMAYLNRARVHRQLGQNDAAEADLRAGIEIYEERLRQGLPDDLRWGPIGPARELFEELILFQIEERKSSEEAFNVMERAKQDDFRTFVPLARSGSRDSARLEEVLAALPDDTAVVQYGVLADRLLIWYLRHDRWQLFTVDASHTILSQRVQALREFSGDWEQAAAELFGWLVEPWFEADDPAGLTVLIPDRALQPLPFAALRDDSGGWLVKRLHYVVAPSATALKTGQDARGDTARGDTAAPALIIGDPAFDHRRFGTLSELQAARQAAHRIAALYPESRVLTGRQADRATFLNRAADARIIHFGGHAIVNQEHPDLSMLLLAATEDDIGVLYARDLAGLDLESTEVVVLGACDTATPAGAGASSLAWAFLHAKSHTVLATLWPVRDAPAAEFLTLFHRHLASGADPAAALRQAQLSFLASAERTQSDPRSWAGFRLVTRRLAVTDRKERFR